MAPPDAAGLDGHDEPFVGRGRQPEAPPLVVLPVGIARAHLPVREELLLSGGRHLGRDDLVGEVLEHHRGAERLRELMHDEVRGRAAEAQGGEAFPHLVARSERGGLLGDDAAVHGLGEGDELHLAVEGDERETVRAGCRLDDGRHVPVVHAEFQHQSGETRLDEARDERLELWGFGRPAGARGEQQLAAVQEPCDAGAVGDVNPAHARIERLIAREHLGHAVHHRVEREDLAHRRQAVIHDDNGRTICPVLLDFATICHPFGSSSPARLGLQA